MLDIGKSLAAPTGLSCRESLFSCGSGYLSYSGMTTLSCCGGSDVKMPTPGPGPLPREVQLCASQSGDVGLEDEKNTKRHSSGAVWFGEVRRKFALVLTRRARERERSLSQ